MVGRWAKKWKMKLNEGKTEAMVISQGKHKWEPKLYLNNKEIKIVDEYKFLGVVIDKHLRFKTHTKVTIKKATKRVNIMKCMAGKEWGQSWETQRNLYLSYVRTTLEYASPSWYPWLSETKKRKLERVQNEALRSISGLTKTCPEDFLRVEANIEPLAKRMKKNDVLAWERYERLPDEDSRHKLVQADVPPRLLTRKGWRNETKADRFKPHLNRDVPRINIQPWSTCKAEFDMVELTKSKAEYKKEELKQLTLEKIRSIGADVEVYTDGSADENQNNGGAGVMARDGEGTILYSESFPAGEICSSYNGETLAMKEAPRWIAKQNNPDIHCMILTDSMSLVQALKAQDWKDDHEWLRQIKQNLNSV